MKKRVHIFVGEYSYAMNWHAPQLNQRMLADTDIYDIVATFPTYTAFYRECADEVHSLPEELWSNMKQIATVGLHVNNRDFTPNSIIEYCKQQFPGAEITLGEHWPMQTFAQTPPGLYKHFQPALTKKQEVEEILSQFSTTNTIVIFPKYRSLGGSTGQNWSQTEWHKLITYILNQEYNVVLFEIYDKEGHGGTYTFDIEHDNLKTIRIDRNNEYAVDIQAWTLKLTKCSIYGSTGAVNLPFWVNTPVYTLARTPNGKRLFFDWQKSLTNDHKNNSIVLVDDFNDMTFEDIRDDLTEYIERVITK